MIASGPRSRWTPKAPRTPVKAQTKKCRKHNKWLCPLCYQYPMTFSNEYGALVYAKLHNQRRLLANKPTFDRVIISGAGGHEKEADLFRVYKPTRLGGRNMPYAIITSRQWPETRFEYSARNIEEASALAMHDKRLRANGVRDYVIITEQDKKGLAKFQAPELEHLFRSLTKQDPPEKIAYNELLNRVADAIGRTQPEVCPVNALEAYRKTQRPDGSVEHADVVAQDSGKKKPSPGATVAEAIANANKTIDAVNQKFKGKKNMGHAAKEAKAAAAAKKTSKKTAPPAPAKASKNQSKESSKAETSKGPAVTGRGKARSGNGAANGKAVLAAKSDGLGRPGTAFRFMAERILKGEGNDIISKACKKEFPKDLSTDPKHVAWCRWKLRKNGVKVPEPKVVS